MKLACEYTIIESHLQDTPALYLCESVYIAPNVQLEKATNNKELMKLIGKGLIAFAGSHEELGPFIPKAITEYCDNSGTQYVTFSRIALYPPS